MEKRFYDRPTMVKFIDAYDEEKMECMGIAYHSEIICACCGGIFETDDECIKIMEELEWVDFSDFIS